MKIYGLSRTRSNKGKGEILKQEPRPYVNCIHTNVGGGWETMFVLVLEVYESLECGDAGQVSHSDEGYIADRGI